jgi:short-subunit dehydrogenase
MAARGADVGLIARGEERLQAARREVEQEGRRAVAVQADVADAAAVDAAAEWIEHELGPIDVWINCAMTAVLAEVMDTRPEEFARVTAVVYLGSVHGTQAALRRMLPRDRGTVIQVGSALARRGIPLQATYCGAKHALMGFYDSLRTELLHHGSRVQVAIVQLPGLNTPQFGWVRTRVRHHPQPVPPIYQPEVAARAIADVAERPKRETWVGFPTALTIIGNTVAPGLVDRYLARTNIKAQQVPDRPIDPDNRRDNLFTPPPGDPGAHGIFDDRAHAHSARTRLGELRKRFVR